MKHGLFPETLLSNGCYIFAYFLVAAQQWVHIPTYICVRNAFDMPHTSHILNVIFLLYFSKSANYEAPHYTVVPIILPLPPSKVNTFSPEHPAFRPLDGSIASAEHTHMLGYVFFMCACNDEIS
jgi:hypothetical protein